MTTQIRIKWPRGEVIAVLEDTPTSRKLIAALPCESRASTWGDEVYFALPIDAKLEAGAKQVVDPGTVCFWVPGRALAMPFGPTPIAKAGECRLASPCNVLGALLGDATKLKSVRDNDKIAVDVVT